MVGWALERRISRSVLLGVGQERQRRTVRRLDRTSGQKLTAGNQLVGKFSGRGQNFGKLVQGQTSSRATIGGVFLGKLRAAFQTKESLELAYHFTAGGLWIETLPERTPESAPAGVMTVAAIGLFASFGEELLWQPLTKALFQLAQSVGTHARHGLGSAGAHGSQAVNPGTKERSVVHIGRYIYRPIDSEAILFPCQLQKR